MRPGWKAGPLGIFGICAAVAVFSFCSWKGGLPKEPEVVNSLMMRLVRVEPGSFQMGASGNPLPLALTDGKPNRQLGDFDEHPAHRSTITRPFYMAIHEVTNAQYEQFDPSHRELRGKLGFSKEDDEAVVFVSWHDAVRFCEWLSLREGRPYRLPTEAEWEYAARAGTLGPFHSGDSLPESFLKNPIRSWFPRPDRSSPTEIVSLTVGQTPANAWGLHDMHGNVEEWCYDWYGPYPGEAQVDPVGRDSGDFRVTRGGSHSTELYYLRSSNRSGTLPEDRSWLIGFRVVMGELPPTAPLPVEPPPPHQLQVSQSAPDGSASPSPDRPYFRGPLRYVNIPEESQGPLFSKHNHDPAIAECPNGDLLAVWYSCESEPGRELSLAASRLRYGGQEWEQASLFWDAPDRNDHAPALWFDGRGTLYHFGGLSAAATWGNLAMLMRTSRDNGASWSKARLIAPEHTTGQMPVESVFQTREGVIVVPVDLYGGDSGLWLSRDEGATWAPAGGAIRGIHAGVVQLADGRLMALGRGKAIDGKMPMSLSSDLGKSWTHQASPFPILGGGQRLAFTRLKEGPLLLVSFGRKLSIRDASRRQRPVSGMFAALSLDEGVTWPYMRLVSDDGPAREIETMDGHQVTMSRSSAEPVGYLSITQTDDSLIHVISSRQYYSFNLAWLKTPAPAARRPSSPSGRRLSRKTRLASRASGEDFRDEGRWRFESNNADSSKAIAIARGIFALSTKDGQQFRLRDNQSDSFGALQSERGFSAEIRAQVLSSKEGRRGVDLELYDGLGSRYAITITRNGVYWYEGPILGTSYLDFDGYTRLVEGVDNSGRMHTFRVAVREDRTAQIYRDGRLIGSRRFEYRTPREPYLAWGADENVRARVGEVSYDLQGPFRP